MAFQVSSTSSKISDLVHLDGSLLFGFVYPLENAVLQRLLILQAAAFHSCVEEKGHMETFSTFVDRQLLKTE
jgi:hypothetical protein